MHILVTALSMLFAFVPIAFAAELESSDQSFVVTVPGDWYIETPANPKIKLLAHGGDAEIMMRDLSRAYSDAEMKNMLANDIIKLKASGSEIQGRISMLQCGVGGLWFIRFSHQGEPYYWGYFNVGDRSLDFRGRNLSKKEFWALASLKKTHRQLETEQRESEESLNASAPPLDPALHPEPDAKVLSMLDSHFMIPALAGKEFKVVGNRLSAIDLSCTQIVKPWPLPRSGLADEVTYSCDNPHRELPFSTNLTDMLKQFGKATDLGGGRTHFTLHKVDCVTTPEQKCAITVEAARRVAVAPQKAPEAAAPANKTGQDAPPCSELRRLNLAQSCLTSQGVLVKRVQRRGARGSVLNGVEVGGLFWLDNLPAEPHAHAVKTCRDIDPGLRLPTKEECETLNDSLDTPGLGRLDGNHEFLVVMPDVPKERYWTSSLDESDPQLKAWTYRGTTANMAFQSISKKAFIGVRCVGDANKISGDKSAEDAYGDCVVLMRDEVHFEDRKARARCTLPHWKAYVQCVRDHPDVSRDHPDEYDEMDDDCMMDAAHPLDAPETLSLFLTSCQESNLTGCRRVGQVYEKQGNMAEARRYYQKACRGNRLPACKKLGRFLTDKAAP
ncbi:MAG: hypothetical protein HY077_16680 [Elusimicrobia bacterium]|nr:hypothetical protein [Elusimicrobiota bacterium]